MANEFKHKDPCTTLTQAEYIGACGDGHVFASQATGDLLYADSSTVLNRLARATSGSQMLQIASCKPAWTATPSLGATSWCNMNHAHGAGNSGGTVCANVLAGTTLKACVVSSSLTSVGTLAALQVDYINANASTLTITDSTDTGDLASLAVTTHGATTLTTTDDDAAAAHFTVDADGNITLDAATGIVTIEDGGTEVLRFTESCSGDVTIKLVTNAKDLIFTDNGDAEGFRILDAAAGVNVAGLLTAGSLDIDNVLINGTTIGHTCDTDLMTVGNASLTIKGDVTVGVDDTGHDVKFFGAAAGAFMIYDQSCDQLEIRGASADATTSTGKLLLSTSLTNVNANDVIGSINFQAPVEAGGTDAITIAAGIRAVAQATFTCAVNATDLIFYTGHSEAATEKFRFTSQGEIGVGGANYGTDGQVLTSGGACAAAAWEDAGGGGGVVSGGTDNAALRADGTGGSTSQGSSVIITDAGAVGVADGCATNPGIFFTGDTNTGWMRAGSERIGIVTAGTKNFEWNNQMLMINDAANGDMTQGATFNQGANDTQIFALKSSDIAHGMTGVTETDTYGAIRKVNPTVGGLLIQGFAEDCDYIGIQMQPYITKQRCTADSNDTSAFTINAFSKSGTGNTTLAADGLLFSIHNGNDNAQFHVRGDGHVYSDYATAMTLFDEYCDSQVVRTLAHVYKDNTPNGFVECRFDKFIHYNECTLVDMGILSSPITRLNEHGGHGMLSITGLQQLHNGAIWQLYAKLETQSEELTALKGQLKALTEGK